MPGEAHIVLHGPVVSKLTDAEFRALLAHELSHFSPLAILGRRVPGDGADPGRPDARPAADTPHFASARLFALYNEVFCDRGRCWSPAIRWS